MAPPGREARLTSALSLDALSGCVFARWSPAPGDPSAMGWATVAAYGLAAVLCLLVALRRRETGEGPFWGLLCVLLAALAVNKELDVQSALTALGRCVAQIQGWYGARRDVQLGFVLAIVTVGVAALAWVAWRLRRNLPATWLALLGMFCVMTFVAVRAVGFHHVDELINLRLHDVRMNALLELTGIVLIAANALLLLLSRRGPKR